MPDNQDTQAIDPRAALLEQAWRNPQARTMLEDAFAIVHPTADIPGRKVRLEREETLKAIDEKERKIDAKLAELDRKEAHGTATRELLGQGYTPEDITAIEKLMVDEGIGTHASAAIVYAARTKVAQPRSYTPSGIHVPGQGPGAWADHFAGITAGDGRGVGSEWARNLTDEILNDFQNGKGKLWDDPGYYPASPWAKK